MLEETVVKEPPQRKFMANIADMSSISGFDKLTERGGFKQKGSVDFDDKDTLFQKDSTKKFEELFKSSPVIFGEPTKTLPSDASPGRYTITTKGLPMSPKKVRQDEERSNNSEFGDLVKMVPIVKDSKCMLHVKDNREVVKGSDCVVFKINPVQQTAQAEREKVMITTQTANAKSRMNSPEWIDADQYKVPTHTAKGSRRNSGLSLRSNPSIKLEELLQVKTGSRLQATNPHFEDCKQSGGFKCDCERRRELNKKPNYLFLSPSNSGRRMTTNDMYRRNNTTNFDEWSEHHPDLWHKFKF